MSVIKKLFSKLYVKIPLGVILTAVLLLILFTAFSYIFYGRSPAATVIEWGLDAVGKEIVANETEEQEFLSMKKILNAVEYQIPDIVSLHVSEESYTFEGMKYYILNGKNAPERTVFYFHGGAYTDQPFPEHWRLVDEIARTTGAQIILPVYPKLPLATASEAYALLERWYDGLCADKQLGEIIFAGDSAGGGMALAFDMLLVSKSKPAPEKLILLSPWVDAALENPDIPKYEKVDPTLDNHTLQFLGRVWAGELDVYDPLISPLFGDFTGIGKVTLFVGTRELFYPDIILFDEKLTESGVEHTLTTGHGMNHVWPLVRDFGVPEAADAVNKILAAVTE